MTDLFAYVSLFFSIIFLGISPFPSLPLILAAYLRFSYAAVPLVVLASFIVSVLQYLIGRYFPRRPLFRRSFNNNRFTRRLLALLEDVNIETLVFIRTAQFVPSKLFNLCCGICKVPLTIFALSLIPMIIVDQFVYLAGASASTYADSFLLRFGLSQYHWFFLFLLYILFVFLFSIVSAFLLKAFLRLFRHRFPVV